MIRCSMVLNAKTAEDGWNAKDMPMGWRAELDVYDPADIDEVTQVLEWSCSE